MVLLLFVIGLELQPRRLWELRGQVLPSWQGTFAVMVVASRVVCGTALLMERIGLSATLGAFLAGVLLADSEYRHELEADISPFKGLLLGLFFMAVGMSVDVSLATREPLMRVGLVLGLVVLKGLILFGLGWWQLKDRLGALRLAISISQGGEFAFVVVGLAASRMLVGEGLSQLVIFVIGASLAITPIAFALFERFLAPRLAPKQQRPFDALEDSGEPPVLIAGFGRVGQGVGRVLSARRPHFVALDASPDQVDFIRRRAAPGRPFPAGGGARAGMIGCEATA